MGPPEQPGPGGVALAVVIPAYQAAGSLERVIAGVRRAAPGSRILVVDDGSSDGTGEAAERAGAEVLRLARNEGKGAALAAGLAAARERAPRFVVTLDADGQHPPERIPDLLVPLERGEADVVIGARRRAGRMPLSRRASNWLSSALVSRALGHTVPDSQSGFRAMSLSAAAAVSPAGRRYEFETEFLLLAAQRGLRIVSVEVPTVYGGEASHFRYGADTLRLATVFLRAGRAVIFGPGGR